MKEDFPDPPLKETYKNLLANLSDLRNLHDPEAAIEECELPLIDLSHLKLGDLERKSCKKQVSRASREWGFFQVINHGISRPLLERMREEQMKLFKKPFREKVNDRDLNFSAGSYRWGTPSATCLEQLSWSEAFHVSMSDVVGAGGLSNLRSIMEIFAVTVSELAHSLVDILAEDIGEDSCFFKETCLPATCYLRLNRYPPCPLLHHQMFGIMPHTDSDFITVLHQDHVGGLQLVKDGKWFAVRPNPDALIINIGDLFQAWSNNLYKSVQHRVVANPAHERFSTAYFFCPSYDTVIRSRADECVYRSFSFGEYRKQVQKDVNIFGHKIGLPRFVVERNN